MKKLIERLAAIYITDSLGVPHRIAPYLGAQQLPMAGGSTVLLPLRQIAAATISPASGPIGTVFTITPARYSGTGPITFSGRLTQNGQQVALRNNQGQFTFTSTAAGPLMWSGQAQGLHPSTPAMETAGATVSEPNAITPGIIQSLPDVSVATTAADTLFDLRNYFSNAVSYEVASGGTGATITGNNLVVTSGPAREVTYVIRATSSTGHTRDMAFQFSSAAAIDAVVFIGASHEEAMFGRSLTTTNAEATAMLAAAGFNLPVYGYATGGARLNTARSHYNAARAAFPNALIISQFGGNNVSDSRPFPGGRDTFNSGLADLLTSTANDTRFYPASLTFRDYDDTTFQNPDAGSRPYNEQLLTPWIAANFPHAIGAAGRPKVDLYRRVLQNFESLLGTDNIHFTPSGYAELKQYYIDRAADILAGRVPAEIPERVYVPPSSQAPSIASQATITGNRVPGSVLTANPGTASGIPTPTPSYQWSVNGTTVAGATSPTFTRPATIGAVPSVAVTWSNGVSPAAVSRVDAAPTQDPAAIVYPDLARVAGTEAYAAGRIGRGLNPNNGFYARATDSLTPLSDTWGVEAWVRIPTVSRSNIAWGENGSAVYMVVRASGTSPAGQACITYAGVNGSTIQLTGGPRIDDNAYHHVAVQFHTDGATLYVDGVSVATSSIQISASRPRGAGGEFTVGHYASSTSFLWSGQVDEVRIWDGRELSENFTPRTAAFTQLPAGTVAYWAFEDNLRGGLPAPVVSAKRAIVLTDYAGDCDDAAALAIACQAHRAGDISLLGVVTTSNVATAAPGVRGQLNAYGMQSIPVYAYQGAIGSYNNRISAAVRDIFGIPDQTRAAFTDDVVGLRTMLANAPDGSVDIYDIGAPVSSARLLDSPADAISPLTGMQLVAAKVAKLVLMSGRFDSDTTPEYNAAQDVASTRRVYQDWPTPVYAHGGELGVQVFSGPPASTDPLTDPVKAAFESYKSFDRLENDKRYSWDPIAIDQGIYGNRTLYNQSAAGSIVVESNGRTVFTAGTGNRYVISRQASAAAIGASLDAQIALIAIATPSPRRKIIRTYDFSEGTGVVTTPTVGARLNLVTGASWRTGPTGIAFNGSGGRLVGPVTNDVVIGDFMVGFLMRMDVISGARQLLTINDADQRIGHFRVDAGQPRIVTFTGGTGNTVTATGTPIAAGEWHMVTYFITNTTGTIRLNGTQVGAGTINPRNRALIAGREQVVGSERAWGTTNTFQNHFDGDILGMEQITNAEATDFAAMESRLRAIAANRSITLPQAA